MVAVRNFISLICNYHAINIIIRRAMNVRVGTTEKFKNFYFKITFSINFL